MYSSEYRYGTGFPYLVVKSLYGFGTRESTVEYKLSNILRSHDYVTPYLEACFHVESWWTISASVFASGTRGGYRIFEMAGL